MPTTSTGKAQLFRDAGGACVVKHQRLHPILGLYSADRGVAEGRSMVGRRWYVVKSQPRRELFAAEQMQNQGFAVFLPKLVRTLRHARRVSTGFGALFPNYLFVDLDIERERWRSING